MDKKLFRKIRKKVLTVLSVWGIVITMTKITIKTIVDNTNFTEKQVRTRLKVLADEGITGTRIHDTLILYDWSIIKQVKDCVLPSEKD